MPSLSISSNKKENTQDIRYIDILQYIEKVNHLKLYTYQANPIFNDLRDIALELNNKSGFAFSFNGLGGVK